MTLFRKELWRIMRSLVYVAMVVGMVVFMQSQGVFLTAEPLQPPVQGLESYGDKASDDPALIMPEAVRSLLGEYQANQYTTYPNGFIKHVRLGETDRARMAEIIAALTGTAAAAETKSETVDVDGAAFTVGGGSYQLTPDGNGSFSITAGGDTQAASPASPPATASLAPDITWDAFLSLMAEADDLLGGGSDYSETYMRHRFGRIPVPYEEAMANYADIADKDRYTGAHARLFSDYAGIILALLPVFPAVLLTLRDRRSIAPAVQTRRVSSTRLILTRFGALVVAVMLPILAMDAVQTALHAGQYGWAAIDPLAFLQYTLLWQLPTAMAAIAAGMFLTTLTGTPIAIATQLLWWFLDISGSGGSFVYVGRYAALIPRHNTLGQTQAYLDGFSALVANRLFIAGLAMCLVALTVLVYGLKRRGMLHVPALGRRAVQPAA